MVTTIMSVSLMLTVGLLGYILSSVNLMCLMFSFRSKHMLSVCSVIKSFMCNPIGSEYHNLNAFFNKFGITHRVSCPHTHQQNGVDERKHRHIVETGLALLAHASVHFQF